MKKSIINRQAVARLKTLYQSKGIMSCELMFDGCNNWALAFAHKEKRRHYSDLETLSAFTETILACQHCHTILDDRSKTSKEKSDEIFKRLRDDKKT
jgi:hypothetical protein